MRWGLILLTASATILLSASVIFGLLPSAWWISVLFWVVVALILGQFAQGKYFMHGFLTGIISSLVGALLVYTMYDTYLANNPIPAEQLSKLPAGYNMKNLILYTSPINAAIAGVVLGLLSLVAGKIFGVKKQPAPVFPDQETPAQ